MEARKARKSDVYAEGGGNIPRSDRCACGWTSILEDNRYQCNLR